MADLRYPIKTIGEYDDYFRIQILEYKPPGLTTTGTFAQRTAAEALESPGTKITSLATVILPMPQQIQDMNATDWTAGTMNPIQSVLTSSAAAAIKNQNVLAALGTKAQDVFRNIGTIMGTREGQDATTATLAQLAANAILGQGDINQTISRATGLAFNQNVELLFTGVQLRQAFNFTFDMVPRSKQESDMIKTIIRTFKTNMTAKKGNPEVDGGGLFIKAPNVFKLEYRSGGRDHPFLHRFKPCALTQMGVNYTGSGQYATYSDATPVHMQMALQFQELSPIYFEEYNKPGDQGTIGVGY